MTDFEKEEQLSFENTKDSFDYITLLFERTNEDGILRMPSYNEWYDGDYKF